MHPDLVAISNVWQRDADTDRLKAEHGVLAGAVTSANTALAAGRARVTAAEAALAAVKEEERKNARQREDYGAKRDATQRMIDSGTAPDYDAATRQLESCIRIVDELETTALELLDRLDAAQAELAAARADVAAAEAALATARAALTARDADLRAELGRVLEAREAAWAELPHEYRTPYTDLRRRKRRALVNVVENTCTECSMRVPPQRLVEVQMARAVHTCPGCQGYILP